MACSMLFAYLVLFLTTQNYTVAMLATISISMVVGTIVATVYLNGWGIGLGESIALIVFIGFSVDYIVHMCHVYVESVHDRRKERVDNAYGTIGGSIIHGAITSMGAGICLTQCMIIELSKFGLLMMMTIGAALVFSLIFYPAISYQSGPQGKEGNFYQNVVLPVKQRDNRSRQDRAKEGFKKL